MDPIPIITHAPPRGEEESPDGFERVARLDSASASSEQPDNSKNGTNEGGGRALAGERKEGWGGFSGQRERGRGGEGEREGEIEPSDGKKLLASAGWISNRQ